MKSLSDFGFVIKTKQFPEADKLVVFLTRHHGMVETVAKGAARSRSKKVSTLDLLNQVRFSYYETKGLALLKEVQVINDYQELKQDKKIVNHLLYLLEILDKLNSTSEGEIKAFTLLKDLLELSILHKQKHPQLLIAFELKLLKMAGFNPNVSTYLKTGEPIGPGENRVLSIGNELGYNYSKKTSKSGKIPDNIIKIQKYYMDNSLSDALKLNIDNETEQALGFINRYWIESIIEKRLKSASLIN